MILIGRMLLLILVLTIIDPHPLLAHSQNPIRVIILMNNWLKYLADLLTFLIPIRLLDPILIQGEPKPTSPTLFSSIEPDKLNNFLFQCWLYFHANLAQFDMDIAKINFAMTYLTGVAQDWFEVGLNQED